jgi:hypothetical protein
LNFSSGTPAGISQPALKKYFAPAAASITAAAKNSSGSFGGNIPKRRKYFFADPFKALTRRRLSDILF